MNWCSGFIFSFFILVFAGYFQSSFQNEIGVITACCENSTELPVPTSIFQINLKYQYIEHIFKEREREAFSSMDVQIPSPKIFFNKMWRNQNRRFSNFGLNLNFLVISHYWKKLMHLCIDQLLFIMSVHEYAPGILQNVTNGTKIAQKLRKWIFGKIWAENRNLYPSPFFQER